MDTVAIYGRWQHIPHVMGRVDYLTNPERQECLLAVGGELDRTFWARLAADCQQAWRESGGSREKTVTKYQKDRTKKLVSVEKQACEAREIQLLLPKQVLQMGKETQEKLLEELAGFLGRKYGMTCALGLHLSKTDKNVHVHILFSERLELSEPEVRRAGRNTFLDEKGIRRRTKKEILDAAGNVRPGCRIVKKGEVIATRYFGDKEPLFADRDWCHICKEDLAVWINEILEPDKKRIVFDPNGPYLAQEHVGKGRAEKQRRRIEEYNKNVRSFNQMVKDRFLSQEEAQRIKSFVMLSPYRTNALGAALAGLLLDRPETRRYLRESFLETAPRAMLERLCEIGTGGNRTKPDPDREKKEKLRALYREAEQLRRRARQAPTELDRRLLMTQARQRSMQIDRLRRELGLYADAEYRKRLKKIDDEIRRRQRRVTYSRARVNTIGRRIDWTKNSIRKLRKEIADLPVFLFPKETRRRRAQLTQEIKQRERELEDLKLEEDERWSEYFCEQRIAKAEKKRLKAEKKQLKQERKIAKQKRRERD